MIKFWWVLFTAADYLEACRAQQTASWPRLHDLLQCNVITPHHHVVCKGNSLIFFSAPVYISSLQVWHGFEWRICIFKWRLGSEVQFLSHGFLIMWDHYAQYFIILRLVSNENFLVILLHGMYTTAHGDWIAFLDGPIFITWLFCYSRYIPEPLFMKANAIHYSGFWSACICSALQF
jgi:hypothetical protein